jgi:hypothetical protein
MRLKDNITLVCASYKGFEKISELLDISLSKNFNLDLDSYLITNGSPQLNFFKLVKIDKDEGWNKNLQKLLLQIKTDYVLLWIDDLILKKPVDQNSFLNAFKRVLDNDLSCLWGHNVFSLKPKVFLSKLIHGDYRSPKGKYQFSTMCSIYKKSVLLNLLARTSSPWEFELLKDKALRVEATNFQLFDVSNVVIKGRIITNRMKMLQKRFNYYPTSFYLKNQTIREYITWLLIIIGATLKGLLR